MADATSNVKNLKQELRDAIRLAQQLSQTPGPEFDAAVANAAQLRDQLNDVNEQIGVLTAGSKFEAMGNSIGDVGSKIMSLDFEGASESAKRLVELGKTITFSEAIKGVKDLGSTFLSLGKALLTNPLFLIAAAIAGIIAMIVKVLDKLGVLKKITEAVGAVFEWLWGLVEGAITAITDFFGITSEKERQLTEQMQKSADQAEKNAKNMEARSKTAIQALDNEIRMTQLSGESTEDAERKKVYWIQQTALARAKADREALQIARRKGELDEEEIAKLKETYEASKLAAKQASDDIKYFEAKTLKDKQDARDKDLKAQQEAGKKAAEIRRGVLAEIRAAEKEFNDSQLSDEQREINAVNDKYNQLIAKAKKYNQDITTLKLAQETQLADIDKKFRDAELAKVIENQAALDALELELMQEGIEKDKLARQQEFDAKIAQLEEQGILSNELEIQLKKQLTDDLAAIDQTYLDEKTAKEKEAADKEKALADEAAKTKEQIYKNYAGSVQSMTEGIFAITNALGAQDDKSKEARAKRQFQIQKALNLSLAVIDGVKAVQASLAQSPIAIGPVPNPAGIASLAFAVSTSVANIAKIAGMQYGGKGSPSSSGGASAASSGGSSATASQPSFNLFGQANQGNNATPTQSAEANTNVTVTAVVSETEITSTQKKVAKFEKNGEL